MENNKRLKVKKIVIGLFFCVAVCMALFAQSENDFVIDEWGMIMEYNGPSGISLVIPPVINGRQATGIGNSVFIDMLLTGVTIPSNITTIGIEGFMGNRLNTLVIPDSVTAIGDAAFSHNWYLKSVTLPNNLTEINLGLFSFNELSSLIIPDNVSIIGQAAFYKNNLAAIVIPDSVTTIGKLAFASNQLNTVVIPDSVTYIGAGAFEFNPLTTITIGNNVTLSNEESASFHPSFDSFYTVNGKEAGTYTYAWQDGRWTTQSREKKLSFFCFSAYTFIPLFITGAIIVSVYKRKKYV